MNRSKFLWIPILLLALVDYIWQRWIWDDVIWVHRYCFNKAIEFKTNQLIQMSWKPTCLAITPHNLHIMLYQPNFNKSVVTVLFLVLFRITISIRAKFSFNWLYLDWSNFGCCHSQMNFIWSNTENVVCY